MSQAVSIVLEFVPTVPREQLQIPCVEDVHIQPEGFEKGDELFFRFYLTQILKCFLDELPNCVQAAIPQKFGRRLDEVRGDSFKLVDSHTRLADRNTDKPIYCAIPEWPHLAIDENHRGIPLVIAARATSNLPSMDVHQFARLINPHGLGGHMNSANKVLCCE